MGMRNPLMEVTGRLYRGDIPSMVNSLTFKRDNRYALGMNCAVAVDVVFAAAVLGGFMEIMGDLESGNNVVQVGRNSDGGNVEE